MCLLCDGPAKTYTPKSIADMSARTGGVILVEYLEEFPLFVANRGMGSKVITYYRQEDEDDEEPEVGGHACH